MRYSLHSRVSSEYLQKADEIMVEYRDRNSIIDLVRKYPEADIVLDIGWEKDVDWQEVKRIHKLVLTKFYVCLADADQFIICKQLNIPFFYGYPISTYYELQGVLKLGVSYVRLAAPLTHDLVNVKKICEVPIRAIPTVAYDTFVPMSDGVCGQWIRPEDVGQYEAYIDIIEFEQSKIDREQAMYRIYAEQKNWSGDLSMLITNLNYPGVNRMIPPSLATKRINCKQACQSGGACHLCYRMLDLANPELLKGISEQKEN